MNSWDVCHSLLLMIRVFLQPSLNKRKDVIGLSGSEIRQNFIIANYHAVWPLDHDDGSCYYYDYDNVLVYGGFKTYLGHSKICMGLSEVHELSYEQFVYLP